MKKNNLLLFGLLLSSAIVGCNNKTSTTPTQDTLRVDVGSEIPTFDPALAEDGYTFRVIADLFAGLVDFDQANRPISGMATWDISADGLTYTFHLKPDLKFSDGSSITASDFVYSWQRLVNPKTGSAYDFLLKDIVNADEIIAGKLPASKLAVEAADANTFVVHLAHPTNAFLSYITTPDVFVVPQKVIENHGLYRKIL